MANTVKRRSGGAGLGSATTTVPAQRSPRRRQWPSVKTSTPSTGSRSSGAFRSRSRASAGTDPGSSARRTAMPVNHFPRLMPASVSLASSSPTSPTPQSGATPNQVGETGLRSHSAPRLINSVSLRKVMMTR